MSKRDTPPVDQDAVAAFLDHGWDLLKKNDFRGAEISAKKALGVDPGAADALTLLGAIAHAEGEDEEALEHYRKAIDLDPSYVAPMLYSAEVLLESDDPSALDDALQHIDAALDVAEEQDETLDCILLKAEVLTQLGRADEAEEALEDLPPVRFPEVAYHLRAARTFLDLALVDDAEKHYQEALQMEAQNPDVFHGLGCVYEQREDIRNMVAAWLKTRELDVAEDPVGWAVSQEEFEKIAEATIEELPAKIGKLLENVPIIAADYPSVEIVAEGNDPRMMGFFSGVPYPEKSNVMGGPPHLDCVFLYKRNIERMCRNQAEIEREIRTTVLHETGHFFGLDEDELDEMGLG